MSTLSHGCITGNCADEVDCMPGSASKVDDEDMDAIGISNSSIQVLLDAMFPDRFRPSASISFACILPRRTSPFPE